MWLWEGLWGEFQAEGRGVNSIEVGQLKRPGESQPKARGSGVSAALEIMGRRYHLPTLSSRRGWLGTCGRDKEV